MYFQETQLYHTGNFCPLACLLSQASHRHGLLALRKVIKALPLLLLRPTSSYPTLSHDGYSGAHNHSLISTEQSLMA